MPISRWLQWVAWAKTQGPLGTLAEDLRAAEQAMRAALPYIPEEDRDIRNFLPSWRKPSDYLPWGLDLGEDPKPPEFVID